MTNALQAPLYVQEIRRENKHKKKHSSFNKHFFCSLSLCFNLQERERKREQKENPWKCLLAYSLDILYNRRPMLRNPSISLINTPTFKEIVFGRKPAGRLLSIRVDFVWDKPPTFKGIFFGGFKNLSAGFLFCLRRRKATAPQGSAAYCF